MKAASVAGREVGSEARLRKRTDVGGRLDGPPWVPWFGSARRPGRGRAGTRAGVLRRDGAGDVSGGGGGVRPSSASRPAGAGPEPTHAARPGPPDE